MDTTPKPWYTSKTIWLAVLTALAALLADPGVVAAIPLDWLPKVTLAGSVVAVILRVLTTKPLGE